MLRITTFDQLQFEIFFKYHMIFIMIVSNITFTWPDSIYYLKVCKLEICMYCQDSEKTLIPIICCVL